jgi:hypothetical protein
MTLLVAYATVVVAACGGSGGGTPGGGGDGNDTFATAQAVAVGSSTPGVISSPSDPDWYEFTTAGAGTVTVTLSGLSADADLALYDSSQVLLAGSSNPGTATDTVTYTAAGADTFHLDVIPVATAASYTVSVFFTPVAGDGNDTFATSQAVTVGSSTAGVISSLSDPDWYKFTTTGAGTITVTLGGLSADANLALYSSAQGSLAGSSSPGTATETATYTAAGAGTFHVYVIPVEAGATYTVTVVFSPAVVADGNDTFATAQAISVGTSILGTISSQTDPDWYRVLTPGAGTITVTLSGLSVDADLRLYGELESLLVDESLNAGTANETVTSTAAGPINYHVLVVPQGSATPYTLTVSFAP